MFRISLYYTGYDWDFDNETIETVSVDYSMSSDWTSGIRVLEFEFRTAERRDRAFKELLTLRNKYPIYNIRLETHEG